MIRMVMHMDEISAISCLCKTSPVALGGGGSLLMVFDQIEPPSFIFKLQVIAKFAGSCMLEREICLRTHI
jgi:hypothetical protein